MWRATFTPGHAHTHTRSAGLKQGSSYKPLFCFLRKFLGNRLGLSLLKAKAMSSYRSESSMEKLPLASTGLWSGPARGPPLGLLSAVPPTAPPPSRRVRVIVLCRTAHGVGQGFGRGTPCGNYPDPGDCLLTCGPGTPRPWASSSVLRPRVVAGRMIRF